MFQWFFNKVSDGINAKLLQEIELLNEENDKLQEIVLKLETLQPTPEDKAVLQSHKEEHATFNEWKDKVITFARENGLYSNIQIVFKLNELLNSVPVTKSL